VAVAKEPEPVRERPAPEPRPAPVEPVHKVVRELPRPPKEEHPKVAAKKNISDEDKDIPPPTAPKPEKPEKAVVEKPAAPAGDGFLRIGSKPWTNIAIDGKDTGLHTPQTKIKLPAGTHRVTLTNPQFNIKETFSVEIKPNETETAIKDLRPQGADTD
jgi:hypothetical protein